MSNRLGLGISGSVAAPAADLPIPSSVTLYAALPDFNGTTTLTSITPRVGDAAGFTVNNPPALNSFGYAMTESSGGEFVIINGVGTAATGSHVSILVRRNETADTQTIFLGRAGSNTIYAGAAQSGSTSTTQTSGGTSFTTMRVNNGSAVSEFATTSQRGDVWNATFANSGYFVITFIDLIWPVGSDGAVPLYYSSTAWRGEADVAGMVKFTDSADAAAVEAKLLSEVA